ncbi:MAG: ArsR/SmtB family transcription factor [Dongiaceae bacterium]
MPRSLRRLEEDQAAELADMFRLMGDPTRLRIILACIDDRPSVGALAERLQLSPSLASHHLRLLRAGRILRAERRGKQVFYSVADDHVRRVIVDMVAHVGEPLAPEIQET